MSSSAQDPFPYRRAYGNACFRFDVRAALPCFHDWIGWYLDASRDGVDEAASDVLSLTFRIWSRPQTIHEPTATLTKLSNARVDSARREVESWPTAEAGDRVPMSDGLLFFTRPLLALLLEEGLHPLHTAFVRKGERRLLITGPGRSGKSTLAVLLSQHGWELLCDDLVFLRISEAGMEIRPLPTRVKYRSLHLAQLLGEREESRPTPAEARGLDSQSPISILYPKFVPGTRPELTALEPGASVARLVAGNVSRDGGLRQAHFKTLCKLGARADAYELHYDDRDITELPRLIESALGN